MDPKTEIAKDLVLHLQYLMQATDLNHHGGIRDLDDS